MPNISRRYVARKTGTADPATTPVRTGDIFINTSTAQMFIATGTSSSADWKRVLST